MPDVNFYQKKPVKGSKLSLIYLQMRYQGKKFVYSCRFSVEVLDWNSKASREKNWDTHKQQVKARTQTTKDGLVKLNTRLDRMKAKCLEAYNIESDNGTPTNTLLKVHMDAYMQGNSNRDKAKKAGPTLFKLIDEFITGDVGEKKQPGTIRTYGTAKKHLEAFQTSKSYAVDFDTITLDFKFKYAKFLSEDRIINGKTFKALSQNSLAKEIKNVRTFMNMAVELQYTTNLAYKSKKFGVKTVNTDAVYLTQNELRELFHFDFSHNRRLEEVRDLFVFSSYVGLRYSDATNIKPENIVTIDDRQYIKIIPAKTQSSASAVIVPCNGIVLKIFEKYSKNNNRLPTSISNQKYNKNLKLLAKEAGLIQPGRLSTDLSLPLYECLTSHTARRNFATNCYLTNMPVQDIMQITGHTTEKSFMKYLKVSRQENARKVGQHMEIHMPEELMKAV